MGAQAKRDDVRLLSSQNPVANPVFRAIPRTTDMPNLLDAKQIKAALKDLPEWELEKNAIERTFEFDDFSGSIDFVNGVAELSPRRTIIIPTSTFVTRKYRIILSTHSKGGLTELDLELAERIGNLVDA